MKMQLPAETDIKNVCDVMSNGSYLNLIKTNVGAIEYVPGGNGLEQLKLFLEYVTGDTKKLDFLIMKHFFWQVKRKLLHMPGSFHIVPIFYGKQGGGKSYSLKRLFNPIEELVLETDVKNYSDDRYQLALSKNAIVFLDEMGKASKADIEALKKTISGENLDPRLFHTQKTVKVFNMSTPIGATNKRMTEIIFDSTGMRRFWEILCLDKLEFRKNHHLLEKLDYLAIWQAINPHDENYLLDDLDELERAQDDLVVAEPLEVWILDTQICPGSTEEIPNSDIYMNYKNWCEDNGHKALGSINFTNKMKNLGYEFINVYHKELGGRRVTLKFDRVEGC
jgi:hypothetical protein